MWSRQRGSIRESNCSRGQLIIHVCKVQVKVCGETRAADRGRGGEWNEGRRKEKKVYVGRLA